MTCPTCNAPAEPEDEYTLASTSGVVVQTKWRCTWSVYHWWMENDYIDVEAV
jgi:hypothetical protein